MPATPPPVSSRSFPAEQRPGIHGNLAGARQLQAALRVDRDVRVAPGLLVLIVGDGVGEELVAAPFQRGWDGYFSLEPSIQGDGLADQDAAVLLGLVYEYLHLHAGNGAPVSGANRASERERRPAADSLGPGRNHSFGIGLENGLRGFLG